MAYALLHLTEYIQTMNTKKLSILVSVILASSLMTGCAAMVAELHAKDLAKVNDIKKYCGFDPIPEGVTNNRHPKYKIELGMTAKCITTQYGKGEQNVSVTSNGRGGTDTQVQRVYPTTTSLRYPKYVYLLNNRVTGWQYNG
jgi:hypothetical protein